jgi:hypothetical protein
MSDYQEIKQLHHELKELADENRLLRRALERLTADERIGEAAKLVLTDVERGVLHGVAEDASYRCADFTERVVRGLLERLK